MGIEEDNDSVRFMPSVKYRLATHLNVVVHALVNGQRVLVQTVGQSAQDIRVSRLLVPTDDYHDDKDQQHDDGNENCHQNTHVVVLGILVDRFGGDD